MNISRAFSMASSVVCLLSLTACLVDSDTNPAEEEIGQAVSPICNDPGNDTEATATDLGDFNDCDDDGGAFDDVVRKGRIDWYRYRLDDAPFCAMSPSVAVTPSTVTVCQYFDCDSGAASFTCPTGTTSATSPGGRPGCCGTGMYGVYPNCSGTSNDEMDVFIRFSTASTECVTYDVDFHG